ncbi:response regulator [Streptomyces sp. NPDC101181]|uniref:response regulator n=1 Tax=Streptomyces sp. NPDC101181 TaxID=3366125 RepID=UPI00382DAA21
MGSAVVTVLVVDDDALVRDGLKRILESADDIRVPAVCGPGDALELARLHRPDVALVDLHMPGTDGVEVLRGLRSSARPPRVAVLTGFGADEHVRRALRAGAAGFLLKDSAVDELIPGVRLLAAGGSALSERVVRSLPGSAAEEVTGPEDPPGVRLLTAREREVLALLPSGMSNEEIGRRLFLSRTTVRDHVSAVLTKLGAANRVQAAVIASGMCRERPGRLAAPGAGDR